MNRAECKYEVDPSGDKLLFLFFPFWDKAEDVKEQKMDIDVNEDLWNWKAHVNIIVKVFEMCHN